MAELTLLLPERRHFSAPVTPTLVRWLVRGNRLADAAPGRDAALRSCFEFTGTALPAAALTRSLDAPDTAGAVWLRADPAWVMADAVTLRLMACGDVGLSADDSAALARALKPLFGDAGFPLEAPTPSRWYLRCPPGVRLPTFASPQDALGDDVARHLPEGDGARQWRHLLNEAQVILHNHPVNAERARRGAVPVNSLWCWGAGALPDWVRTPHARVLSDDDVTRALARLAGVAPEPALAEALADASASASVLADLVGRRDRAQVESAWVAPVHAQVEQRRWQAIELRFESGERHRYRRPHRWRFWRRLPAAGAA
jgi:hypothetical protein